MSACAAVILPLTAEMILTDRGGDPYDAHVQGDEEHGLSFIAAAVEDHPLAVMCWD